MDDHLFLTAPAEADACGMHVELQLNGERYVVRILHGHAIADVADPMQMNWDRIDAVIDISDKDGVVFSLRPNGKVETSERFSADEAARTFWQAMALAAPNVFCRFYN